MGGDISEDKLSKRLKNSVIDYTSVHAVFDKEIVEKVLRELRETYLVLSVVRGIFDEVFECCREVG